MNKVYAKKDLNIISWKKVDELIDKIHLDVLNYIETNNLKIKYICSVMRGGGVPAIKLSHMFNVIDMLLMQLKSNIETKKIDIKIGLEYVKDTNIKNDECILLVDGNHCTGRTANFAVNLLREKFGENVKIIYVALTTDYTHRYSVKNLCYTTWGILTNSSKELSKEECEKLGINYDFAPVHPWENVEEELFELNKYSA